MGRADFDDLIRTALADYSPNVLAAVASKLFRPRIGQPTEELIERIVQTQANPPVVDRLLKGLPEESRLLLAALGRSRQPRWRAGDLMALTATLGTADGFSVIAALLERGLMIAVHCADVADFTSWFHHRTTTAEVFIPPAVLLRAAALELRLRPIGIITAVNSKGNANRGDGLDWYLRTAVARQQVRIAPVKVTHSGSLYKRDLIRFTGDAVLQSPLEHGPAPVEAGLLALSWARSASLLSVNGELTAAPWPQTWMESGTGDDLFAAAFAVRDWDPLSGAGNVETTATNTAGLAVLLLLADAPNAFQPATALAAWLWEHHPHWSGLLPKSSTAGLGTDWVEAWLQAVMLPLGVVESIVPDGSRAYRLTEFGKHLLANGSPPDARPAFPQTLLVQPNGEILVYRQGLTPALITQLSSFAQWKQIGAACTLELTAESVTRGLEDGGTLEGLVQTLNRHGMKPMPANVADLLHRWANKRERIVAYPSATLVEFVSPAELDEAVNRGIVSVRLTDRIGLTASGKAPEFNHLRLIGNRDYEARPSACVVAEDDGVTLRVDAAAADLLLDAEIARFAKPLAATNGDARRYRMSPETLRNAAKLGHSLETLDEWFLARSGEGLPPAAKLFLTPAEHAAVQMARHVVVETPTKDIADGILQWSDTASFAIKRLGPTALVVREDDIDLLKSRLMSIGIRFDGSQDLQNLNGWPAAGEDHANAAV